MRICFWKHHPNIDQNGYLLGQATILYQQRFGFDFIKLMSPGPWMAVCYGALDEYQGDYLGRRAIVKPLVTHYKDWINLAAFCQSYQPEMLQQQLIASQMVCQAFPHVDVCATVFSPLSQAIQLAGIDLFRKHLKLYPDEVEKGLKQITQNTHYIMSQFAATGVKRLFYVMQHTQEHVFPRTDYQPQAAYHDADCLRYSATLFEDTLVHLHGEHIYWGLSLPLPHTRIHYATHPTNPTPSDLRKQAQLPVIAGISAQDLVSVQSLQEACHLLDSHFKHRAANSDPLLTCSCVLPFDFSDQQTDLWIQSLSLFAH